MPFLLSVVVPCFNQGHYIMTCIDSLLAATSARHEVIIVNDGSTDLYTARHLSRVPNTRLHQECQVISQANGGLSNARNTGIKHANGKYVLFLDADDLMHPDTLDKVILKLEASNLDVVLTKYMFCSEDCNKFWSPDVDSIDPDRLSFFGVARYWERGLTIPIHSGVFRKAFLDQAPFNEHLMGKEDWIFWLETFLKPCSFDVLEEVGAVYRMHGNNMTRDGRLMGLAWIRAAQYAKKKFVEFDDYLMMSAIDHLRKCYYPYFWQMNPEDFACRYLGSWIGTP